MYPMGTSTSQRLVNSFSSRSPSLIQLELTSAQLPEVLRCLWDLKTSQKSLPKCPDHISVEFHLDSAHWVASDGDIEEDHRVVYMPRQTLVIHFFSSFLFFFLLFRFGFASAADSLQPAPCLGSLASLGPAEANELCHIFAQPMRQSSETCKNSVKTFNAFQCFSMLFKGFKGLQWRRQEDTARVKRPADLPHASGTAGHPSPSAGRELHPCL